MVLATTRPCSSDVPSTLTLSPGISTALDICCLSRPKSPFLSLVVVSSVRTTVVFPSADFTIKVSPVRVLIIPLTLALSPLAPQPYTDVRKNNAIKLTTIVFRFMRVPPALSQYRRLEFDDCQY